MEEYLDGQINEEIDDKRMTNVTKLFIEIYVMQKISKEYSFDEQKLESIPGVSKVSIETPEQVIHYVSELLRKFNRELVTSINLEKNIDLIVFSPITFKNGIFLHGLIIDEIKKYENYMTMFKPEVEELKSNEEVRRMEYNKKILNAIKKYDFGFIGEGDNVKLQLSELISDIIISKENSDIKAFEPEKLNALIENIIKKANYLENENDETFLEMIDNPISTKEVSRIIDFVVDMVYIKGI